MFVITTTRLSSRHLLPGPNALTVPRIGGNGYRGQAPVRQRCVYADLARRSGRPTLLLLRFRPLGRTEHAGEAGAQGGVEVGEADRQAEVDQGGDAVAAEAAGHDAAEVLQVRLHVDGDAVIGDPAAHAHADGGDLVLTTASRHSFAGHPDEEHTSELQSLMRISYAVFCLKKKKKTSHTRHQSTQAT